MLRDNEILQVIADVTRYPLEILAPEAELEEDLGIDSVKRAEIVTVLQQRFQLPEDLEVAPERIRTIQDVADVVRSYAQSAPAGPGSPVVAEHPARASGTRAPAHPQLKVASGPAVTGGAPGGAKNGGLQRQVIEAFIEATRYPEDILDVRADLEEDLGIDSVKRAEIFALLQARLALPDDLGIAPDSIHTIEDVVQAVAPFVARRDQDGGTPGLSLDAASEPAPTVHGVTTRPNARPMDGKVALVTGAGHGIGKVIACRLAALGARVVLNSFHSRELGERVTAEIAASGGQATHVWGSVAKPEHLDRIFTAIDQRHGHLDFFVSNASNGIIAPLDQVSAQHWDRAFRTNVVALHQGAYRALPLMRKRGGGRIVCLSSPGAQQVIEHFGCMGPVKAALESLTRYLAVELGPHNIQVNAVSAGPIYGALLEKYPDSERLIPYWESRTAGRELGTEDDVADLVMFLLSAQARKISGSVVLLDGAGSQRI